VDTILQIQVLWTHLSRGETDIYEAVARAENQAADMAVRVLIPMACFIITDLTSNIFTIYIPYFVEWKGSGCEGFST